MTPRVYTLATGGWLITREGAEPVSIGPLPVLTGQRDARDFAMTLRMWADDVERRCGLPEGAPVRYADDAAVRRILDAGAGK